MDLNLDHQSSSIDTPIVLDQPESPMEQEQEREEEEDTALPGHQPTRDSIDHLQQHHHQHQTDIHHENASQQIENPHNLLPELGKQEPNCDVLDFPRLADVSVVSEDQVNEQPKGEVVHAAAEIKTKTSIPTLIIVKDGVRVDEVINSLKNRTYEFIVPGLPSDILEIIYTEDEEPSSCKHCRNKRKSTLGKRAASGRRKRKAVPAKARVRDEFSPLDVVETIYENTDDIPHGEGGAVAGVQRASDLVVERVVQRPRLRRMAAAVDKKPKSEKKDGESGPKEGEDKRLNEDGSDHDTDESANADYSVNWSPMSDGRNDPNHEPGKKACPVCKKEYSRKYLKRHMRFHTNDRPFKCDQCDKAFKKKDTLQNHKTIHTRSDPIPCKMCDKYFVSAYTLECHINRMHKEDSKKFECPDCGKKFINKYEMDKHQQAAHRGGFKCTYCEASYLDERSYKKHVRHHTGQLNERDLRYKCDDCDHIADTEKLLRDHKMLHSGEKPHLCDTCGARFRLKKALTQHQYCHSDIKRFKCNECGEAFKSRSAYQDHEDRHKGIKRHVCQFCGQQFYASSNMFKHIKSNHSNEKNFECHTCGKRFSSKQELQQHSRSHKPPHVPQMHMHQRAQLVPEMRTDPTRMQEFTYPTGHPAAQPGAGWLEFWNPL